MTEQDEVNMTSPPADVPAAELAESPLAAPPRQGAVQTSVSADGAQQVPANSQPPLAADVVQMLAQRAEARKQKAAEAGAAEKPAHPPVGEEPGHQQPSVSPVPVPDSGLTPSAGPAPAAELRISWQQKGREVAPLLEMRAYLDQLRDAGVAVGTLQLERDPAGKLSGGFKVSYDPTSSKLAQLEATLQGFRQVGQGLAVQEKPEQAAMRRQEVGYDNDYEPLRSKQVREAFGARQWDGLSAQLSAVPKHALTAPEQVQQAAAEQRVQQLARQQGTTTEQIIRDGKSVFDIDTSGNPASAFLKNFYAHLNGGPKTRQNLEVDYERTRQHLQARLTRQAGAAQPELTPLPPGGTAQAPPAATAARLFEPQEVPQQVLASLGLRADELARSGQLQRLLSGHKTDLLSLRVAGEQGREPVRFEGKMVLHREADGTATLKLELPQAKLLIPHEIGGQPITAEQRQRLEAEGSAGLVQGLQDEQGREFNGYLGVDKAMNTLVVLPQDQVTLQDTVAGVKLTPEQSQDLRLGKVVALANMSSGNGGQQFDGTVQINAAKACLEIRPAVPQPGPRQALPDTPTLKAPSPSMVLASGPVIKMKTKVPPRH